MKELVVISGKGGTGKTSLVACFAALAAETCGGAVLADCDVDAADLHLVVEPEIKRSEPFFGGSRARIIPDRCTRCGKCAELCRFGAISCADPDDGRTAKTYHVDPVACEGCGVCAWFCTAGAVEFARAENGQWFVSQSRFGPMVHARLGIAEENSGKLVSLVREEARKIARQEKHGLLIIDGSPGIGCPVIASITAADLVLVVTEPTLSGMHDLDRVAELTKHFDIETLVCINKWDVNADLADQIQDRTVADGAELVGRIRYDAAVTEAQIQRRSLVEYTDAGAAGDVKNVWSRVAERLNEQ